MQVSSAPVKFNIPFAAQAGSNFTRQIPQASQIAATPGAASLTDGFPPLCFIPVSGGGVAPSGQDFNGLLNQITAWCQWVAAGGPVLYDAVFQMAIGGYPLGAQVGSVTLPGVSYRSTVDGNTTNPDAGGAGWARTSRIKLDGAKTLAVSSTGNDATGSLTSPFLTAQGAYAWALYNLDLNQQALTINFGAGNFGPLSVVGLLTGQRNMDQFIISGATTGGTTTLGNVATGAASAAVQADFGACFHLRNVAITNANPAGSSLGVVASHQGMVSLNNISFGACADKQLVASNGGQVFMDGQGAVLTITGGAQAFAAVDDNSYMSLANAAITVANAVTYTQGFVFATWSSGMDAYNISFTGAGNVTGPRYRITWQSVVNTNGSGASYFPGTVAGTADATTFAGYV